MWKTFFTTIEGDKLDVLTSTAQRAIQKAAPPNPPPQLPEEFRSAIVELVIQKELYCTNVSKKHNCLSIPTSQISDAALGRRRRKTGK
ncbi:hypothetical protein SASPL_123871 [Salvia splendens]|uniref:Uncharacterized protein n=1 Tax=Salvia splendens TaxID=180675 RepID=A0A8X8ZTU5_SALSN|nr:hypothetical protein SASPL_123871 [Salvia splendens]